MIIGWLLSCITLSFQKLIVFYHLWNLEMPAFSRFYVIFLLMNIAHLISITGITYDKEILLWLKKSKRASFTAPISLFFIEAYSKQWWKIHYRGILLWLSDEELQGILSPVGLNRNWKSVIHRVLEEARAGMARFYIFGIWFWPKKSMIIGDGSGSRGFHSYILQSRFWMSNIEPDFFIHHLWWAIMENGLALKDMVRFTVTLVKKTFCKECFFNAKIGKLSSCFGMYKLGWLVGGAWSGGWLSNQFWFSLVGLLIWWMAKNRPISCFFLY